MDRGAGQSSSKIDSPSSFLRLAIARSISLCSRSYSARFESRSRTQSATKALYAETSAPSSPRPRDGRARASGGPTWRRAAGSPRDRCGSRARRAGDGAGSRGGGWDGLGPEGGLIARRSLRSTPGMCALARAPRRLDLSTHPRSGGRHRCRLGPGTAAGDHEPGVETLQTRRRLAIAMTSSISPAAMAMTSAKASSAGAARSAPLSR